MVNYRVNMNTNSNMTKQDKTKETIKNRKVD
jgi:hypothetical protein